jgi:hypothetical protein
MGNWLKKFNELTENKPTIRDSFFALLKTFETEGYSLDKFTAAELSDWFLEKYGFRLNRNSIKAYKAQYRREKQMQAQESVSLPQVSTTTDDNKTKALKASEFIQKLEALLHDLSDIRDDLSYQVYKMEHGITIAPPKTEVPIETNLEKAIKKLQEWKFLEIHNDRQSPYLWTAIGVSFFKRFIKRNLTTHRIYNRLGIASKEFPQLSGACSSIKYASQRNSRSFYAWVADDLELPNEVYELWPEIK